MYAFEAKNIAELEVRIESMKAELAEYERELDASGVEDATEWERFPEYEGVLYALAEFEVELAERKDFERSVAEHENSTPYDEVEPPTPFDWEAIEHDELIELVELAEESAMSELAAFGNCAGWFFGSCDASIV